jgi:hypothetical protein
VPGDQSDEGGCAREVGEHGRHPRRLEIAAQHPRGGNLGQRPQRRQGESGDDHQPDAEPAEDRPARGGRQLGEDQRAGDLREPGLGGIADGAPGQARREAQHQQLRRVDREDVAPGRAEALHHRRGVDVTRHVAPGGDADGRAREQHAHQGREAEELAGALERGAQLRSGLAHPLQPRAARQQRLERRPRRAQRALGARQEQPVAGS